MNIVVIVVVVIDIKVITITRIVITVIRTVIIAIMEIIKDFNLVPAIIIIFLITDQTIKMKV